MKRINHFAWLARRENAEQYVRQLEALLETKFELMSDDNVDAYVNWDSRVEVIAPAAGSSEGATYLANLLEERGEGPFALAIRVQDLDGETEHARSSGFEVGTEVTPADPAARLAVIRSYTTKIDDIRETQIGDFLGTKLVLCQIDYADEKNDQTATA